MIHKTAPDGYREMEVLCGTTINEACRSLVKKSAMIAMGRATGIDALQYPFMRFNDVILTAGDGETADGITKQYRDFCDAQWKAYRESPEGIAEAAESAERQRLAAIEAAKPMPTFAIRPGQEGLWAQGLANNQDGYGMAVYRFAAKFAHLFETRVYGKDLDEKQWAEAFDQCERDADNEGGITGFQHGSAMSMLRSVWAHGVEIDARKRIK